MDRLSLNATERKIIGKKVKHLRKDGLLPAHVYGKGLDSESVTTSFKDFIKVFNEAGETGLIDLKIGEEKVRPVLVRDVQYDPLSGHPTHIDFYQVNLLEKVKVAVPLVLIGEEPEVVHLGEAIVLQTLNEVEVEALPTDLVEKIEVDISTLKNVDDGITVGELNYDKSKLTISGEEDEVVVKLAPAVSAQTQELLEEQAAETAAAAEGEAVEGGPAEGPEPVEGEAVGQPAEGEIPSETPEDKSKEGQS